MFIAIADTNLTDLFKNCDHAIERWTDFYTTTDDPIFMGMTFESVCESIKRYYQVLDDEGCPDYTIYEISDGSWTVAGERTIAIDIERHDDENVAPNPQRNEFYHRKG